MYTDLVYTYGKQLNPLLICFLLVDHQFYLISILPISPLLKMIYLELTLLILTAFIVNLSSYHKRYF